MLIKEIAILTESLDQPYQLGHWRDSEHQHYVTAELPDSGGLLEIDFERRSITRTAYEINFYRDGKQHATGGGDEFRIFATVLEAIRQFIDRQEKRTGEKPDALYFTALKPNLQVHWDKRPSRANLYTALVRKYAQRLGYKYLEEESREVVIYRLTKMVTESSNAGADTVSTIIQNFLNSDLGKQYAKHDCKSVTRAFVRWAQQNDVETRVLILAPPSSEVIYKRPQLIGKSGQGDGHMMPVVQSQAIDFTVRQFPGMNQPYEQPLITPLSRVKAVYEKIGGYFTDAPDWFLGGKSHYLGTWAQIPPDIADLNFGDEILENFRDGKGPGRPGDSARHGIPKNATLSQLDKIGKGSGRKAQLARWQANMRRGRKK